MRNGVMLGATTLVMVACGEPVPDESGHSQVAESEAVDETEESDEVEEVEDTGVAEEEEVGPFTLSTGSWVITESEVLSDECGIKEHVDRGAPGSVLVVHEAGEGEFFLEDSEGDSDRCVLNGRNFVCDASQAVDDTARNMGFNADIHYETAQSGAFSSDTTLSLRADVDLDCVGSDCGLLSLLLGNFPCNLALGMELSPVE